MRCGATFEETFTLAKATSKDKGATTRPRAAGAPVRANAGALPAALDDDMHDEEDDELEPEKGPDPEDIIEAEEDAPGTELVVRNQSGGSLSVSPSVSRAPARSSGLIDLMMRNPVTRFIAEAYLELLKVTWPTREQAWSMTLVVIGMSAVVAIILATADLGLARFLTWVLNIGTGG